MKNKFSEYYQLEDSEIKKHWDSGIFCFDANVLLNLYRYTPKTRNAFFNLFEKIRDRIWIPYQAAYEYQKNRLSVINEQKVAYEDIKKTLEKKKNEIEAKLNSFKKHPYLQASDLKHQIESAFASISKDLEGLERQHPDYLTDDPIFHRLTELLNDHIGDDSETNELEKIYQEGRRRYEQKIPPGYMDEKEKKSQGNRALYGDLIVWKQIISETKELKKSIIFVTDDLKEDWWYKFQGKTISARPELLKEFRNETKQIINIYQADRFLEYANKNLKQNTEQDAIDEVRKVRLADEEEMKQQVIDLVEETNSAQKLQANVEKSGFEKAIDEHAREIRENEGYE